MVGEVWGNGRWWSDMERWKSEKMERYGRMREIYVWRKGMGERNV